MSEENVAVVGRAFDAYTRGDIDGVLRLCADDILITPAQECSRTPATTSS
jgi:ketosteroid isomerase-like protein